MKQDGRGDVVRDVSNDDKGPASQLGDVGLEHVTLDYLHAVVRRVSLPQIFRKRPVDLYRDQLIRPPGENVRQRTSARTDLDDGIAGIRDYRIRDRFQRGTVNEEMLPETL